MSETTVEKHAFQAEIQQLLDLVVHSLYTDKEIFLRELISNASDSMEKLRHIEATEKDIHEPTLPLEIHITTDAEAKTLTIADHGIGMTRDELVKNLGTIAHSGTKAFLKAMKDSGSTPGNMIGQFGVGFYSAFMVADEVKVSHPQLARRTARSSSGPATARRGYEIEEASRPAARGEDRAAPEGGARRVCRGSRGSSTSSSATAISSASRSSSTASASTRSRRCG